MSKQLKVPTESYTNYEISDDQKYVKVRGLANLLPDTHEIWCWLSFDEIEKILDASYDLPELDEEEEDDDEEEDDSSEHDNECTCQRCC